MPAPAASRRTNVGLHSSRSESIGKACIIKHKYANSEITQQSPPMEKGRGGTDIGHRVTCRATPLPLFTLIRRPYSNTIFLLGFLRGFENKTQPGSAYQQRNVFMIDRSIER